MIQAFGNDIYKTKGQKLGDKGQASDLILRLQEVQKKIKHPCVSAKHIGLNLQVFIVDLNYALPEASNFQKVFVNLELNCSAAPLVSMLEDDVSIPRLSVSIERPKQIEVSFMDEQLKEKTETFSDFEARWVLHGIDQINGVSIIDKLNKHRKRSVKGHLKRISERKVESNYELVYDD